MKKVILAAAMIFAGSVAMAEDVVSYDFSTTQSSDIVQYDSGSYGDSDSVVKYDIREEEKTLQETSKTKSK
ncbi:MAG: hypothetical protein L3J42_02575 [Hydrogenimonas sp.]|nr:hypothetical protein [Hydrogenimonas sp.]